MKVICMQLLLQTKREEGVDNRNIWKRSESNCRDLNKNKLYGLIMTKMQQYAHFIH